MGFPEDAPHRKLGWLMAAFGAVGVVSGVIPFATNTLRIVVREDLWGAVDLMAHGVEAMGLTVEWGMLSSAAGLYLGILLLVAGTGWLRGRAWAAAITWAYVLGGLAVNLTDMVIFLLRAKPGSMRTWMLLFDGVALAFPVALGLWLLRRRAAATR